ncbi:MAG: enolase [Nitrosopumilus sp.]
MPKITSIEGRVLYNSRGSKTIEVDIVSDNNFLGRVCAPSGASVGKYEAVSFPNGKPEESLRILKENTEKFVGHDASDLKSVHDTLKSLDNSTNYSDIGGALAFAVTIASMESASKALNQPLFQTLSSEASFKFPYPLGNILGGGAHAGPGTPDIQEILICATGSKTIEEAIETNLLVHKELRKVLQKQDPTFTNGRGDEGGWAPKLDNEKALEASALAIENLGYTLGKEVSLGVDFASSTQWDEEKKMYIYDRAGFENSPGQQIEFAANIIEKYKLIYAEDAVHEEAFADMSELTKKFPNTLVTGDDLTVTNKNILSKAIESKSCNAAILKVNQAGSLFDAMEFADVASKNSVKLITSHRSGESTDSHISHIGLATKSKMLKVGIVGGERVAKLNELLRLSEHDLIRGMVEV